MLLNAAFVSSQGADDLLIAHISVLIIFRLNLRKFPLSPIISSVGGIVAFLEKVCISARSLKD